MHCICFIIIILYIDCYYNLIEVSKENIDPDIINEIFTNNNYFNIHLYRFDIL